MLKSTDHTGDLRRRAEIILNELASERDPQQQDDVASFIMRATEVLKLARRIGWHEGVGLSLLQLARRQEPREAERTLRRALALFRRLRDRSGEASTLNNLALIYWQDGQSTMAMHFLCTAYGLLRELDDIPAIDRAMMLLNLTAVSFEHSIAHAALIIAEESIDFCRRHDLDTSLVRAYGVTGRALWRQSFDHLALEYATRGLQALPADGSTSEQAEMEANYASIALDLHKDREAREHGIRAAELFAHLQSNHERAVVLLALGIASLRLEDRDEARRYLGECLALGTSGGSEYVRACTLNVLGELCIRTGQIALGMRHAEEARGIGDSCGDRLVEGLAHRVLYRGAKALGDMVAALVHLERSLVLARDIVVDGDIRFSDLPVQRELEEVWRRQATFRMALPVGNR
jgi:tetratricopeptide (TPR) repeat protein